MATSYNQMDFRPFVRVDKFPIGANMGLLTALVLFAGTVCLPVVGTGSLIYCRAFEVEDKTR